MIKKKEDFDMADNTDSTLIRRVQDGNEEAFNELYEQYHRLVYFIAYEICRNDADAKDILQDTFVQIRRSISTLKEPENFKPWLNRVVINKCKNLFRSRRHVEMDRDDLWYQHHVSEERSYMLPEASAHAHSDRELLHEMIGCLNMQQREVLIMRYFQHMSMKEMAELLEVPEGTVKTRLLYGKNHLKKMILSYEQESGTKLDFHVEGASLALLFLHMYEQGTSYPVLPLWMPKKLNPSVSSGMWNGAIAVLSASVVGFSAMAYGSFLQAADQSPQEVSESIVLMQKSKARENYYMLMDWACCRDDMLVKSKAQFEAIMPVYQEMVQGNSLYLERLKQDHWIDDFEEIYAQF